MLRVKVTSESRLSTTTRRSWSPQRPIAQTSVTGRGRPQCEVARAAAQLAGAPLTTGVVELSESARLRNPFGTHSAGSASMPMTLRLPPEAASSTAYLDCELCPRAYRRGTPSFRSFGACSHPLHVCISPPGEVTESLVANFTRRGTPVAVEETTATAGPQIVCRRNADRRVAPRQPHQQPCCRVTLVSFRVALGGGASVITATLWIVVICHVGFP